MFKITMKGNFNLDSDKIIKEAMLGDMIKKVPQVEPYKQLITFDKNGDQLTANFSALPTEVVLLINEAYELK